MITGIHAILYSKRAETLRAFLRDVLEWPSVDAGGGWPIFAAPPAEIAVHPTGEEPEHELYLMCDDVRAAVDELGRRGIATTDVQERPWGLSSSIEFGDGESIGLYQPSHLSPLKR